MLLNTEFALATVGLTIKSMWSLWNRCIVGPRGMGPSSMICVGGSGFSRWSVWLKRWKRPERRIREYRAVVEATGAVMRRYGLGRNVVE
jgi:hypothetical protein